MQEIRFTQSARKHRIGKARARYALDNSGEPGLIPGDKEQGLDDRWLYIGMDDRGIELEIIAIVQPDHLLVIHVMPTALKRRSRE